nr:hypothetical protein [Tanacetum cinerariifolium]
MDVNLYMFGALMLYWVCIHVYSTNIITVDQGRCEKWGIKLTKEVANPRCLSYSICNPAEFSLNTRKRQRVLTFGGPRQEVVTNKNTVRYYSDPTRLRYKVGSVTGDPSVRILKGMEKRLGDRGGGCCEVGGGGVVGGVGVVCGDCVDRGVGGVDCRVFVDFFVGLFVVVFVEENWSHGAEGKDNFIKCDMTRTNNFVGVQVKATISAMIVRVPKKDRWYGTRGKFVRWKGVSVTKASKFRISKGMEKRLGDKGGGGGGGVVGGVGVVCGDGVDRGVGGVDCEVFVDFFVGLFVVVFVEEK